MKVDESWVKIEIGEIKNILTDSKENLTRDDVKILLAYVGQLLNFEVSEELVDKVHEIERRCVKK